MGVVMQARCFCDVHMPTARCCGGLLHAGLTVLLHAAQALGAPLALLALALLATAAAQPFGKDQGEPRCALRACQMYFFLPDNRQSLPQHSLRQCMGAIAPLSAS